MSNAMNLMSSVLHSIREMRPGYSDGNLVRLVGEALAKHRFKYVQSVNVETVNDCISDRTATHWAYQFDGGWVAININAGESIPDWFYEPVDDEQVIDCLFVPINWIPRHGELRYGGQDDTEIMKWRAVDKYRSIV